MELQQEILINKYGQGLVTLEEVVHMFNGLEAHQRRSMSIDIINLIVQSKPIDADIDDAIIESGLKRTFTPCVLLKKGVYGHNLQKIIDLPSNELLKAIKLLFSLFRVAYNRRFLAEMNNPDKWWYWDLSDKANLQRIIACWQ